jgi:hypothetical protein
MHDKHDAYVVDLAKVFDSVPASTEVIPFTPDQEKRLREIAWEAAQTVIQYRHCLGDYRQLEADRLESDFLNGKTDDA